MKKLLVLTLLAKTNDACAGEKWTGPLFAVPTVALLETSGGIGQSKLARRLDRFLGRALLSQIYV